MNRQDILNIKLGARQMPLFFEKNPREIDPSVGACILKFAQRFGSVDIRPFMDYAQEILPDLSCADILQSVFRLASDQEIGFRSEGRVLFPFKAKKQLLESPEKEISIIFHQTVEKDVLVGVQHFFTDLTGDKAPPDFHELARHLVKQIRHWRDCLNSCRQGVQRPRFPGKEMVSKGLLFIDTVFAQMDPYSLIHAFYDNRKKIFQLSEDSKTLYEFYLRHENAWEFLIRAADEYSRDAEELSRIPDVSMDLIKLDEILLADRPFRQVEQALRLVDRIRPHHEEIVRTKTDCLRKEAASKAGSFIEVISANTVSDKSGSELRRETLQNLRSLAKNIDVAEDIAAIREALEEAEYRFEEFQEKIIRISS